MQEKCPKCEEPLDLTGVEPGQRFTCAGCKSVFMMVPEDGNLPRVSPTSERGCVGCIVAMVIMTGLLFIALLLIWPRLESSAEMGFVRVLRTEAAKQEIYRADLIRDDDGDGVGEYVFVADMPAMAADATATDDAPIPGIPHERKERVAEDGGLIDLGAYTLVLYLPGADGSWVRDPGTLAAPADQATADARERAFILYAVPNVPGWFGSRVFVIDQGVVDDTGERRHHILALENPRLDRGGRRHYDGENLPEATAAYPTAAGPLEHPLGTWPDDQPTTDGLEWRPITPAE
jgi:hypothetical protein